MTMTPVLEIGGSHVTAAVVDRSSGGVVRRARRAVRAAGTADEILGAIGAAASEVAAEEGALWGVAVPGPFDYPAGIGRFHGVGKFDALDGIDVGAALRDRIDPRPAGFRFLNDAVAFGLGEWRFGGARGHDRAVAITLGTGVGSAFIHDGLPVTCGPTVPPEGRVDLLTIDGRPLEETLSTRAIVAAYGSAGATVADVAMRAAGGEARAIRVLESAYVALGHALAPWLTRFDASVLVVGGGMSAAWELIADPLRHSLPAGPVPIRSADTETSALTGAAEYVAARRENQSCR